MRRRFSESAYCAPPSLTAARGLLGTTAAAGSTHGTDREKQKRQKRQVGDTQSPLEQWITGLVVLAGLVLLVWFPLILLATPGTTTLNPPLSLRTIISKLRRSPALENFVVWGQADG